MKRSQSPCTHHLREDTTVFNGIHMSMWTADTLWSDDVRSLRTFSYPLCPCHWLHKREKVLLCKIEFSLHYDIKYSFFVFHCFSGGGSLRHWDIWQHRKRCRPRWHGVLTLHEELQCRSCANKVGFISWNAICWFRKNVIIWFDLICSQDQTCMLTSIHPSNFSRVSFILYAVIVLQTSKG